MIPSARQLLEVVEINLNYRFESLFWGFPRA